MVYITRKRDWSDLLAKSDCGVALHILAVSLTSSWGHVTSTTDILSVTSIVVYIFCDPISEHLVPDQSKLIVLTRAIL